MQSFTNWKEFTDFVYVETGQKLFSSVGISYRKNGDCILRSVDNTEYYDDRFTGNICYYTLYGREGDQSKDEPRFNVPLMQKAKRYFVYRVLPKKYIWYGEYKLDRSVIYRKQHPDRYGNMRKIYKVKLYKL